MSTPSTPDLITEARYYLDNRDLNMGSRAAAATAVTNIGILHQLTRIADMLQAARDEDAQWTVEREQGWTTS